jgi:putative ABC transport system permease protein
MDRVEKRLTAWGVSLERLRRDLALAVRGLRRAPGFTAAAVAILGFGIGMSTAMLTIYRSVLVERLPVTDQDRLIIMHPLDRGGAHIDVPLPYLKVMRRDSSTMRAVAYITSARSRLRSSTATPHWRSPKQS